MQTLVHDQVGLRSAPSCLASCTCGPMRITARLSQMFHAANMLCFFCGLSVQDLHDLQQQQLPYMSGPMGPITSLPTMTLAAPGAHQQLQQMRPVQQVQQALLPAWGPAGPQALVPDGRMGWAHDLAPY